jgi:hypothetical protein
VDPTGRLGAGGRESSFLDLTDGQLGGERRKLLDAYYAGAIDVAVLRAEQQRIGGELRTAELRLAAVVATLERWREVLDIGHADSDTALHAGT